MICPRISALAYALLCVIVPVELRAAQPWDVPFSGDTASILKAAGQISVPADQPVDILLEDYRYELTADGHLRERYRKVYRITRQDAVEEYSSVVRSYQPWRDTKPTLRARVVTSDGVVHNLDPKTIADTPAAESDDTVFSDARIERAPLPAVALGAIVEFEISVDSGAAYPGAGVGRRVHVFDDVPLERFHLSVDVAKGVPFQSIARNIPDTAIRRSGGSAGNKGVTHVECELGPLSARKTVEGNLPFDVSPYPYLAFSSAQSWQTLAAGYSAIVDAQIQAADLKALMGAVDLTAPPAGIVVQLTSQLHRNIRYTGIEFGDAAIIPAKPADVMLRKYGDCKDKSALLVAMLRAAGLKANVALLNSGFGLDVDTEVPGVDLFDHAIVYVDLPGQPLWIDATASEFRVGVTPSADQGRQALIASKDTTALSKIPEQADAWERRTYEIHFREFGPAAITEIMEARGPEEASLRSSYVSNSAVRDSLEKYVKASYRAKSLGRYEVSGTDDLSTAVRVSVEAVDSPQAVTTTENAQVGIDAAGVLRDLPYGLKYSVDDDAPGSEANKPRSGDFIFPSIGASEQVYRLFPPPLFKANNLPASKEIKLGSLTYSRSYKLADDGVVEIKYRLEVPQRRIGAGEYTKIQESLRQLDMKSGETITFVPETAELLAIGETGKAISLLRDTVARHPDDATAHIRFSRLLVNSGFGGPAREEALKATELDPKSSQAWQALAWAWQNDSFGRLRQGDWNKDEAVRFQRKAVEADPDDMVAKTDLAIVLEFNPRGERYADPAGMKEAIALYREVLKKQASPILETNLLSSLFYSGQTADAADEAAKAPDPQRTVFLTAITAMRESPAKAIVNLQSAVLDASGRAQYLVGGSLLLAHVKRYDESRIVLQAASRAANSSQLAPIQQLFAKMKRPDEVTPDPSDPRTPVQQLLMLLVTDQFSREKVKPLVTAGTSFEGFDDAVKSMRLEMNPVSRQMSAIGLSWGNMVDLMPSLLTFEKDGDDAHGYRISQPQNPMLPDMYVVPEAGSYKILGGSEDVGRRVLDLLKQNDLASAQWWLDKAVPQIKMNKNGWVSAARAIWSGVVAETRGPEVARLTAAAMMAAESDSPEALAILESSLRKAKNDWDKAEIEMAFCEAYSHLKQWDQVLAHANKLKPSKTFSEAGFYYIEKAGEELGDWKTVEAAALDQTKEDVRGWRTLAVARMRAGNASGTAEALDKMKTAAHASTAEIDEIKVWSGIFQKKTDNGTLASLQNQAGTPNYYLMALVASALKNTDEAQDALKKAIGDTDPEMLDARAWVVYGNICGQYGFASTASAAWERARKAKNDSDGATWALATLQ